MRRTVTDFAGALLFTGLATLGPSSADALQCKQVRGHLQEIPLADPCASPVGLCTTAHMFGSLRGEAVFTASNIIPSADTPITGVVFVIGDTVVVDAELAGRRGTITIKNAAAFRTIGDNSLADAQTIIGGTGDFVGASGSLRISGDFVPDVGGSATYEGFVCFL